MNKLLTPLFTVAIAFSLAMPVFARDTAPQKAMKQREVQGLEVTQAEIVTGNGACGRGTPSYFQAEIKNTGKVKASFKATLKVWHKGKEATHNPPAMSIAPGASHELKVPLKSIPVTKAELSILEVGAKTPVTKSFPGWDCLSIP
jgi:hypothetical protein